MPQFQVQPLARSNGKILVLLGVGLGVFMSTLDVGIINVALPSLVQGFHTDFPTTQWAVLSYQLVSSSLVLGATRLGDMWGKKYLYLGGLIVFTLSSLLCGFAPSIEWLIGFRALQGLGSVFISGLGLFLSPNNSTVMGSAARERLGIASGLLSLSRTSGNTVGVSLIGAVFGGLIASLAAGADVSVAPPEAIVGGFQGTFRFAALILCGATIASVLRLSKRKPLHTS